MPSFALIADSHLPACASSAQEAALSWALEVCVQRRVDAVAAAGDLTAAGGLPTVHHCLGLLRQTALPLVTTPGNAELRTPHEAEQARLALSEPACFRGPDWSLVAADSAAGSMAADEKKRVEKLLCTGLGRAVLVTHWPPHELPGVDLDWLEKLCWAGRVGLIVAGHKHFDAVFQLHGVPVHLVRGLDPDKAKGGPPAVAVFRCERQDGWQREDVPWRASDPRRWSAPQRRTFAALLGVSTMSRTLAELQEATAVGVPCVEVRAEPAMKEPPESLQRSLANWRSADGRILSVHAPAIGWKNGAVVGGEELASCTDWALRLGADRLTVHVPRLTVAQLAGDAAARPALIAAYARGLQAAAAAGRVIGVENLHMRKGEPADRGRGYGYTPEECLDWIQALRQALPGARVGLHLDLGHARNNAPLSGHWTLGRWYAAIGHEVVGYHLHQVTANGNHQPLHEPFGPPLSLASFFWAWDNRQLAHAPMFLEIRGEPGWISRRCLLDFLAGGR